MKVVFPLQKMSKKITDGWVGPISEEDLPFTIEEDQAWEAWALMFVKKEEAR